MLRVNINGFKWLYKVNFLSWMSSKYLAELKKRIGRLLTFIKYTIINEECKHHVNNRNKMLWYCEGGKFIKIIQHIMYDKQIV